MRSKIPVRRCIVCHIKTKNNYFCSGCEQLFLGVIERRFDSEIRPGLKMRVTIEYRQKGTSEFKIEQFYGRDGYSQSEVGQFIKKDNRRDSHTEEKE